MPKTNPDATDAMIEKAHELLREALSSEHGKMLRFIDSTLITKLDEAYDMVDAYVNKQSQQPAEPLGLPLTIKLSARGDWVIENSSLEWSIDVGPSNRSLRIGKHIVHRVNLFDDLVGMIERLSEYPMGAKTYREVKALLAALEEPHAD